VSPPKRHILYIIYVVSNRNLSEAPDRYDVYDLVSSQLVVVVLCGALWVVVVVVVVLDSKPEASGALRGAEPSASPPPSSPRGAWAVRACVRACVRASRERACERGLTNLISIQVIGGGVSLARWTVH
jgi:hypothetical protein